VEIELVHFGLKIRHLVAPIVLTKNYIFVIVFPTSTHPRYLNANLDELRVLDSSETHIFKNWGNVPPDPLLASALTERELAEKVKLIL